MTKHMLIAFGLLLTGSSMAIAQSAPAVPGYPDVKVLPVENAATPVTGPSMRHQLSEDLVKAGYQDIKITPEAFIVQAKNKAGDPVTMFLSPDSMTVFTAQDAKGQDEKTATAATPPTTITK